VHRWVCAHMSQPSGQQGGAAVDDRLATQMSSAQLLAQFGSKKNADAEAVATDTKTSRQQAPTGYAGYAASQGLHTLASEQEDVTVEAGSPNVDTRLAAQMSSAQLLAQFGSKAKPGTSGPGGAEIDMAEEMRRYRVSKLGEDVAAKRRTAAAARATGRVGGGASSSEGQRGEGNSSPGGGGWGLGKVLTVMREVGAARRESDGGAGYCRGCAVVSSSICLCLRAATGKSPVRRLFLPPKKVRRGRRSREPDGRLEVVFEAVGSLGLQFDQATWPRLYGVKEGSLASCFTPTLCAGLLLAEIEGRHVATRPMDEVREQMLGAGRPLRVVFAPPQPVIVTFKRAGSLGLNFNRGSANPLVLRLVSPSGLAAALDPPLQPGLLLTAVGESCVAGRGFDGAVGLMRNASRPLQLHFTSLPAAPAPSAGERGSAAGTLEAAAVEAGGVPAMTLEPDEPVEGDGARRGHDGGGGSDDDDDDPAEAAERERQESARSRSESWSPAHSERAALVAQVGSPGGRAAAAAALRQAALNGSLRALKDGLVRAVAVSTTVAQLTKAPRPTDKSAPPN
jgi:hypothetical protein